MPRPVFRLDALLQAYRREEAFALRAYARQRAALEAARGRHQDAVARLEASRALPLAAAGPGYFHALTSHLGVRCRIAAEARTGVARAEEAAGAARTPLLRVARLRAALELLRDRQRAAHARDQRAAEETERDEQSRAAALPNEPAMRVLVVDDAPVMRAVVAAMLQLHGFEVAGEAASGGEALAQYEALVPNAVTLDVGLPDMDGAAAVGAILAVDPDARIVACGSSSQRMLLEAAVAAGARAYIAKPLQPRLVGEALALALASARNPPEDVR